MKRENGRLSSRFVARLVAVQTLYQIEATRRDYHKVLEEMNEYELGELVDFPNAGLKLDRPHLKNLVEAVIANQSKIDGEIDQALVDKWRISAIDPIFRALFRAARGEMLLEHTPPRAIISEFVAVSRAFDARERSIGFVNAVLDRLAGASKTQEASSEGDQLFKD